MSYHGLPCWYELASPDPAVSAAFYSGLMGWTWADSGVPGMDYRLASLGQGSIAGMMKAEEGQPPGWSIYYAVDDCDKTAALAERLGGKIIVPPADIPGTGRFSILIDPQGAVFGLLQPLPMEDGTAGGAFDQQKAGHGNWHELLCANPQAALDFYAQLFGWALSRTVEMGPDMTYYIFNRQGQDIGGMFATTGAPMWKPYFGSASAKADMAKIPGLGGKVLRGPDEVPGGAFIVQLTDPHGAALATVGPA